MRSIVDFGGNVILVLVLSLSLIYGVYQNEITWAEFGFRFAIGWLLTSISINTFRE